jgi:hypothetical protein
MSLASLLLPILPLVLATGPLPIDGPAPQRWNARWIVPPDDNPTAFGVFLFRRTIELPAAPAAFKVHVTADNRYQLFVNGRRVASGPARSDLHHWQYDTIDLAPHLTAGKNVLAAIVWNFAEYAPWVQITRQTGFLLQGDSPAEDIANSDARWKVARDAGYKPHSPPGAVVNQGEELDARKHPWGWEQAAFDDLGWKSAKLGPRPVTPADADDAAPWILTPRRVPFMAETPERIAKTRRSSAVTVPDGFPATDGVRLSIPPRTEARVLLDQTYLTTAYPELTVSGGAGAEIRLRYAEALNRPGKSNDKGQRDEIDGKELSGGREDVFVSDGQTRVFRPLFWRTYRYVELVVKTSAAALTIDDLHGVYTGYPFVRKARFSAPIADAQRILDTGWRTARLCAHDTYMDCPYYEQLQYVGDTRIQALVSLYQTGDARLMRNAILQLDESRIPEGLTYSRYPTHERQFIPPFSLWWVGMVHDFWRYQDDAAFVRERLPGMRAILAFFARQQRDSGSLGWVPWWNFVDWVKGWPGGVPPGFNPVPGWNGPKTGPQRPSPSDPDGASAPLDLQLLLAYRWAADLEAALGSKAMAAEDRAAADKLARTIQTLYWDAGRGLYADRPVKKEWSQHANVLAVLAGVVKGPAARTVMDKVMADASLAQASIYFRHYVSAALHLVGQGDRYVESLGPWRDMLARGLTTWSETADPTRSDCHAWGASPNFELFRTVLGIDSAGPGFSRVIIQPHLGTLDRAEGAIPHPRGEIAVRLAKTGAKLAAEVSLPAGVQGEFVWRGHRVPLKPGANKILL